MKDACITVYTCMCICKQGVLCLCCVVFSIEPGQSMLVDECLVANEAAIYGPVCL